MPTTYKLIAKTVLGTAAANVEFAGIPSTYTDLLLTWSGRNSSTSAVTYAQFNGSTATIYSGRYLEGSGSAAQSYTENSQNKVLIGFVSVSTNTANTFNSSELYIPNYAGSNNKSISISTAQETNAATAYIGAGAGVWASTAAITSINILAGLNNFVAGSSFYLYGITKA